MPREASPEPAGWTRAGKEHRLAEAVDRAFNVAECVLIPVFALGKTQEALAMFYKFTVSDCCPNSNYIGGLSSKMTDIRSSPS